VDTRPQAAQSPFRRNDFVARVTDRLLKRAARDGQKSDPDPERAPLVRRAFEDYA